MHGNNRKDHILVVDDSPQNVDLLKAFLAPAGYKVTSAQCGEEALERLTEDELPDLVILDVMMPGIDGYHVCEKIKADHVTGRLPVIMLTALTAIDDKVRGYDAGADDFLSKPVDRLELLLRVKTLLRTKHLNEDLESARDVIYTLALAIEANDPYTRGHSERVSHYGVRIAEYMDLDDDQIDVIRNAGILHDIGKIGISDSILKKPGPLTDQEMRAVQNHPVIGEKICKPLRSANVLLTIIRHHQERFDGDGYPDRLAGAAIPIEARVISVADAYDAMTSPRPYRPALSPHHVLSTLRSDEGQQWDPDVVEAFLQLMERASGSRAVTREL